MPRWSSAGPHATGGAPGVPAHHIRQGDGAHDRALSSGATLRVAVAPGSTVARVMAILGGNRILSVYDSVEDAQAPGAARALSLAPERRRPLVP